MLIAALVVGGLTAWYFGLRPGAYAAVAALLAFVVAAAAPAWAIWAYGLVGAGVIGVCIVGPKRADPTHAVKMTRAAKAGLAALRARWPFGGGKPGGKR